MACRGPDLQEWCGEFRQSGARPGLAGVARRGQARKVAAKCGRWARCDMPGLVLVGQFRLGPSRFAWARHGVASPGLAAGVRLALVGFGKSWFGSLGLSR